MRNQRISSRSIWNPIINIDKRGKFIISITLLSIGLLVGEFIFSGGAVVVAIILGLLTNLFFFISMYSSGEKDLNPQAFILPFLCSFSFSLFYFLSPSR